MAKVAGILKEKGTHIHTVEPDATVYEAIEKMVLCNIGALLVVEGARLRGIITERDYLKHVALRGRSSKTSKVSDIMTERLVTVALESEVEQCMSLMTGKRIRHLPVMDGPRLVGIVSIGDIVKAKMRDQDAQIQDLTNYIQGTGAATYVG